MNEQPKWYILHTYSGYEAMVKDRVEKLIENNNLGDYIVDVKIPMEHTPSGFHSFFIPRASLPGKSSEYTA